MPLYFHNLLSLTLFCRSIAFIAPFPRFSLIIHLSLPSFLFSFPLFLFHFSSPSIFSFAFFCPFLFPSFFPSSPFSALLYLHSLRIQSIHSLHSLTRPLSLSLSLTLSFTVPPPLCLYPIHIFPSLFSFFSFPFLPVLLHQSPPPLPFTVTLAAPRFSYNYCQLYFS